MTKSYVQHLPTEEGSFERRKLSCAQAPLRIRYSEIMPLYSVQVPRQYPRESFILSLSFPSIANRWLKQSVFTTSLSVFWVPSFPGKFDKQIFDVWLCLLDDTRRNVCRYGRTSLNMKVLQRTELQFSESKYKNQIQRENEIAFHCLYNDDYHFLRLIRRINEVHMWSQEFFVHFCDAKNLSHEILQ